MILQTERFQRDPMPSFAFFDFDGTLTRTDTVLPFLKFCYKGQMRYYAKLVPLVPMMLGYILGKVPNAVAKEKVIGAYLDGWSVAQVAQLAEQFAHDVLPHALLPVGMEKLTQHQAQGDICVLVSASPEWYLIPWAKAQGFDAVMGTKMAQVNGYLNGKIDGENCHDEGKVRRIEAQWGEACWINSCAYSDSRVDLPMLRKAERGYLLRNGQFEQILD